MLKGTPQLRKHPVYFIVVRVFLSFQEDLLYYLYFLFYFIILLFSSNYVFKGLAFETLGPWCKEAIDFINVIGNRLIAESGDSKSKKFLFERISLAIQRGNFCVHLEVTNQY
jgi:hypothetical protein